MTECETCGDTYSDKRKALGYRLCLTCGEEAAREQRMGWCIVPLPKQGYTRVNKKDELKQLNQKVR